MDFKNDGIDGTGLSLFLHPVYFIQFSMTQDERKWLILCLKIEFSDGLGGYNMPSLHGNNTVTHSQGNAIFGI